MAGADPSPYALLVADLNRDGKPDVLVGNVQAPSAVYYNAASGRSFHETRFGDGKGTVYGFDVADLNGDGQLDIAAARSEAPNVVYLGNRRR